MVRKAGDGVVGVHCTFLTYDSAPYVIPDGCQRGTLDRVFLVFCYVESKRLDRIGGIIVWGKGGCEGEVDNTTRPIDPSCNGPDQSAPFYVVVDADEDLYAETRVSTRPCCFLVLNRGEGAFCWFSVCENVGEGVDGRQLAWGHRFLKAVA